MICSKCSKENPEGMQFCGYCGNNLQGKVQCPKCGTWVDQSYQYCPFCAQKIVSGQPTKLNNEETVAVKRPGSGRFDRNKICAIITNSLVILFSSLMVILLFFKLAFLKPIQIQENLLSDISIKVDLFDYFGTAIKSLSNYSMEDFNREGEAIGIGHARTTEEMNELLNKINILNVFVINEFDQSFIFERIFIFVNLAIALAMMVLPAVAIGFGIYDLVKFRKRPMTKKLLVFSFMLGLIMVITTLLMGFKASTGIIFYLIFCGLGLIAHFVLETVAREKKFIGKVFATRLVTSLALLLMFILSTSSVVNVDFRTGTGTSSYSNDLIFRDFAGAFNKINSDEIELAQIQANLLNLIAGQEVDPINKWVNYIDFSFVMIMLVIIGLLIASITIETFRNLDTKPKKSAATLIMTWLAFGFEILALIMIIVIIIGYNSYFARVGLNNFRFSIGAGIIFFIIISLATAIYLSVTHRIQNPTVQNI
jgi:hypothetical protein